MRLASRCRVLLTEARLRRVLHWPLSLLFLYSGGVKLLQLPQFAQAVGDFGIVADGFVRPAALLVCLIELGLAVLLWQQRSGALLATAALLVVFLSVLAYGLAIGLDIECGCFGSGYKLQMRQQLVVDLVLLLWCVGGDRILRGIQGEENDHQEHEE